MKREDLIGKKMLVAGWEYYVQEFLSQYDLIFSYERHDNAFAIEIMNNGMIAYHYDAEDYMKSSCPEINLIEEIKTWKEKNC